MTKPPSNPSRPGPSGPVASGRPADIAAFLREARAVGDPAARSRLVFALDATMSRQPTWDHACALQAEMFREAAALGGLSVQLVYFRGLGECRASRWVSNPDALGGLMARIDCRGGHTQIGRVLSHVRKETAVQRVRALVFVGDAMEEGLDPLCALAGELGVLGVRAFMFQEGNDAVARQAFGEIARLTGGAFHRFDEGAAGELGALLRAVAAYAAGGRAALERLAACDRAGARLLAQMS